MVCKSFHGLAPEYLSSQFERRETTYNLHVRDSESKLRLRGSLGLVTDKTKKARRSFRSYNRAFKI